MCLEYARKTGQLHHLCVHCYNKLDFQTNNKYNIVSGSIRLGKTGKTEFSEKKCSVLGNSGICTLFFIY